MMVDGWWLLVVGWWLVVWVLGSRFGVSVNCEQGDSKS
ncbi:MAG: hypothetical protein TRG1_1910 [Flavobacteriaceae bacterium FS1-H7996/R]|nr:MAG: hypothetical protein TRG1_1910 [Flavobacteriaceae bacterium FS1-H7996/R]